MYCAVTGSFNTVSFPSVTVVESLVQVTVVAGPPVEIQVRVNFGGWDCSIATLIPPGIEISPAIIIIDLDAHALGQKQLLLYTSIIFI